MVRPARPLQVSSTTSRISCTRTRMGSIDVQLRRRHGAYRRDIGRLGNATLTDYSAAIRRGVKIKSSITAGTIRRCNLRDSVPNTDDQVAKANSGIEKTKEFYRLFMVPGMTHCSGGVGASNFGGVGQQIPPMRDASHDLEDRARGLGRARNAAESIHPYKIHGQSGKHELDSEIDPPRMPLSGCAAVQRVGRSERRG